MDDDVKVLERIYDRFNARDIDGVLTVLTDDDGMITIEEATAIGGLLQRFLDTFETAHRLAKGLSPGGP
jgi:hypothetical protein